MVGQYILEELIAFGEWMRQVADSSITVLEMRAVQLALKVVKIVPFVLWQESH